MTTIIIILLIILVIYIISKYKNEHKDVVLNKPILQNPGVTDEKKAEIFQNIVYLIDEHGRKYREEQRIRQIPRKTFILGNLRGKYWGELDQFKTNDYQYNKFYDFNIYEAYINDVKNQTTPFDIIPDSSFPREKLPALLPITLLKNGTEYEINIHEPLVSGVIFNRKLHQNEGKEVFGTIEAVITGFLLDFVPEEYTEKIYLSDTKETQASTSEKTDSLTRTKIPTGNTEYKTGYGRNEYYYSDYKTRYWGDWKYEKKIGATAQEGCLSSSLSILGLIIGIAFLLLILPQLFFIIPLFLLPFLLSLIPAKIWNWLFGIIGVFIAFLFLISIIDILKKTSTTYVPRPLAVDKPEERKSDYTPVFDSVNKLIAEDTLITHYRSWSDYDGKLYEGKFWVRQSLLAKANFYKNTLEIDQRSEQDYDRLIYHLKENDKSGLNGLYQLFDSLKTNKQLSVTQFAEMVVSFVQDIPYCIVLPNACNPNLYADRFIREYLSSRKGDCDGFERFGINTPLEFIATLQGDCDTRTLLLYTILSNYDYDVALLSSEYYNHSIIGINLPYEGVKYLTNEQSYVLWETTAPNIRPGILPLEISNTDYWRISLKSK